MTPVIPWSMTNISLIPGVTFTLNKNNQFTRCSLSRKPVKRTSCSQKLVLLVPTFATSFPQSGLLHRFIRLKVSATGTDVTVEEPDSPVLDEGSSGASETQADAGETMETSPAKPDASPASTQSRRTRPARKSEMPPVKNEDLIPGAMFTGKVRSIQPFGAFVDFGAFTDGLVHVSRLSDSYVKDAGSVVSIGQEVQVRLIEANTETGRISLSMRERDDPAKVQQQGSPATASSDKPRPARRNTGRSNQRREEAKSSKFVKGQELEGTVKNLTRSGAFISLPEGEEGFLPTSEESDDGLGRMLGSSSLEVGQEVSVRVLRLSRGQVTLTMKKEEDQSKLDTEFSQGVIHAATNPFVLAFRQNKDIAAFLDDREKVEEPKKKASEKVGRQANQTEVVSDVTEVQEQLPSTDAESVGASTGAAVADENVDSETTLSEEKEEDSSAVLDLEGSASTVGESIVEIPSTDSAEQSDKLDPSAEIANEATSVGTPITEEIVENQPTAGDEISSAASVAKDDTGATSDENGSVIGSDVQEDSASPQEAKDQEENVKSTVASVDSIEATVFSSESQTLEEIAEKQVETAQDDAQIQTTAAETETIVSENKAVEEVVADQAEDIKEVQAQTPAAEAETTSSEENAVEEVVESQVEDTEKVQIQTPATETETTVSENKAVEEVVTDQAEDIKEVQVQTLAAEAETTSSEEKAVNEVVESQVEDTKEVVQIQTPAAENGTPEKVESTAENATKDQEENVESTVASLDSSEATVLPSESQALEEITEKQVENAQDDAQIQKPAAESETTVSENEAVEEVVTDQAEDIKEVQVQTPAAEAETTSSEENAVEEVVESQVEDTEEEVQIQTPAAETETTVSENKAVEEVVESQVEDTNEVQVQIQTPAAETEATVSENKAVEVVVGSQVEDTKEAVQIQTPAAENGTPEKVESTPENATKATISPALVKQLREETGAGMMDCKKALSETGGDIVKAQEYLRKKGLASAEKKASRATAEGRIGSYIHDSRIGVLVEVNCETDFVSRGEIFKELVDDIAMQVAACPQVQYLVTEDVPEEIVNKEREIEMQKEDLVSKPEQIRAKIVEGRIRKRLEELALLEQPYIKNDKVVIKDWVKQTIATIGENIKVKRFVRYNLGEGLEKKSQDFAAEVAAQTAAKRAPAPVKEQRAAAEVKEAEEKKPAVAVSAALVKQLREETGAGMMDCKKALSETGGDLEKAQEYLRKKGLSTADKKSSRLAAEGRIGAYIHDSRIGVLIEINCETDFVGRSENFKELVNDLAMQVVACPQVQFVSIEDIPEEIVKKEKELEMQREDLASKPENIRERIVEGRVSKRLGELTLLEQPFIKNDSILVKDLVKQTVAALGENIKVRRFVRFTLGETAEGEKAETGS